MQKSVEGSSFSSSGNFHDRNRFGSQYAQGGSSYNGGSASVDTGDWKSKILESGQWLGGKVIEYGGKLARGPTTDSIPDQYAQQMPRNDGRANWMADIRSSTSSLHAGGSGSGGYASGYQNDFATERPKAYSDFNRGYSSNLFDSKVYGGCDPKSVSQKSRHAKKKKEEKKSKKKNKKSKTQKRHNDSEEESESEELSILESSDTESADERRHKSKVETKKKKKKTKKRRGFYSEESESDLDQGKRKASADYLFSFDPAKLPPPPAEDQQKVTTKKIKVKKSKDKAGKKSSTRQHSVASTDDESNLEKDNLRKATKRSSKKASAAASIASVDLLGVDLDVQPVAQSPTSGRFTQEMQASVFDVPKSQNSLQDMAGLSFAASVQGPAPMQPSVFDGNASATLNEAQVHSQSQIDAYRTNLLPENNLVDLRSLVSEKKKTLSANPEEKRTLNDMQKARGTSQPTSVIAMSMQGQQQQSLSGSMMQLNMNQLQITNGATGMQQHMYPNMQMQQIPIQAQMQQMPMQARMAMTRHPQIMNIQMAYLQ